MRTDFHKLNFNLACCSLLLAILYFLYAKLAFAHYYQSPAEIESLIREAYTTTFQQIYYPEYPERLEMFLVFSSLLSLPFLFGLFFFGNRKIMAHFETNKTFWQFSHLISIGSILIFLSLFCVGLLSHNNLEVPGNPSNAEYYFGHSIAYNHFFLYLFSLILLYSLYCHRHSWPKPVAMIQRAFQKLHGKGIVLFLLTMVLVFFYQVYNINSIKDSGEYIGHLNGVYYPLVNLLNRETVGYQYDLYGLYQYFLIPIFKIIEPSVLNFTFVMSALICLSYLFIYLFLKEVIQNRLIQYLAFFAALYAPSLYKLIVAKTDYYFQCIPIRTLFPYLSLYLSARYIRRPSWRLYLISAICYSVAILWNPDSGIIVFIAWLLLLCYLEIKSRAPLATIARNIVQHLGKNLAVLCGVLALFSLTTALVYKHPFVYQHLFGVAILFSKFGFGTIPMLPIHPWNIYIFVCAIGFFIPLTAIFNKRITTDHASLFFIAISGLGMFYYFQGRSHNGCLIQILIYPFLLFAFFADQLYRLQQGSKNLYLRFYFVLMLLLITFPTIDLALYLPTYKDLMVEKYNTIVSTAPNHISTNIEFVKKYTQPGEEIMLFADHAGVYLGATHTAAVRMSGAASLYLRQDFDRLVEMVAQKKYKIFLGKEYVAATSYAYAEMAKALYAAVQNNYQLIETNGSLYYLTPRL